MILFSGSILGWLLYGNLGLQPQITSDFIVSSNHVYAFMTLSFLGYFSYENHKLNFIRAWHGHKKEQKYILILSGSIKVSLVKINNWKKPNKKLQIKNYYLNEKCPQMLYIPGGYAHGTQNLKKNTSFIVFSNFSINQSLKDDFRYPYDYWGDWKTNYR